MSIVKETSTGQHFLEKIKTGGDAPYISGLQLYQKNLGSDGASGNTIFTLSEPYSPGSNTLFVYLNGQKCTKEIVATAANEYEETDPYTVTFGASLLNSDTIEFIVIGAYVLDAEEAANILGIVTGTKMYFYQASAPLGWTIDTTLGDSVLAVHGSSSYAGSGSGGVQAGTWTQPNHTHTISSDGAHTHTVDIWASDYTGIILSQPGGPVISAIIGGGGSMDWDHVAPLPFPSVGKRETTTSNGSHDHGAVSGAGATANTWRPKANVGIIATRN
jgi:hypothetical protein